MYNLYSFPYSFNSREIYPPLSRILNNFFEQAVIQHSCTRVAYVEAADIFLVISRLKNFNRFRLCTDTASSMMGSSHVQ